MTQKINFDETPKAIQSRQAIGGNDGVLTSLIEQLAEAELDSHLTVIVLPNRKKEASFNIPN